MSGFRRIDDKQPLPLPRRTAFSDPRLAEAQRAVRGQSELSRPEARDRYLQLAMELRPRVLKVLEGGEDAWDDAEERIRTLVRARVSTYNEAQVAVSKAPLHGDAADEIYNLLRGTGPLQALLDDPTISDIIVPGPGQDVIVERNGVVEYVDVALSADQIRRCIKRMLPQGHPVFGQENPEVNFSYRTMRLHALHESLAPDGPTLTIRRRQLTTYTGEDLIRSGTLPRSLWDLLCGAVAAGANIIIAGPVGSAKTTLLGALLSTVPEERLLVTIEDPQELWLERRGVRPVRPREADSTGLAAYAASDAARSVLRMRPDVVILGEMRDGVAYPYLRLAMLGQAGTISTIHAEDAQTTLLMLTTLARMHPDRPAVEDLRTIIVRALHLIVVMGRPRGRDGRLGRAVMEVAEVRGLEDATIVLEGLYERRAEGLWCCGHALSPRLADKFEAASLPVPRLLKGLAP